MMKRKVYELDVGIPLASNGIDTRAINGRDVFEMSQELEQAIGRESVSAGCGFGFRDMQFNFDSLIAAERAEQIFKGKVKNWGIKYEDGFAYSSVYPLEDEE